MPPISCERAVCGLTIRPGGEHAEQPRHPHLAGVGVHPHLGELRAEGVHRVAARRARLAPASPRRREPVGRHAAAVLVELVAQLAARPATIAEPHDAVPSRAAGDRRAAAARCRRSRSVDASDRRRRARRRRSARARSTRRCRCRRRRSRRCSGRRRRRGRGAVDGAGAGPGRSTRRRRCRPASGPRARTRARVAAGPAEPLGALAQALDEVAAGERQAGLRVDARARCGSAARPGRCRSATASSSIAALEREHARAPRPGARMHVGDGHVERASRCVVRRFGAAYIIAGGDRGLLGELLDRARSARRRRGRSAVSRPSRVGAEPDALDRRRAVAGEREHLLPRERELHRPPDRLRGHRGERSGCGCANALGAEAAADVGRRSPAPAPASSPKHRRPASSRTVCDALVGVVERQRVAVPRARSTRAAPSGCCARRASCRCGRP